jgi:hypothetical protein
MKEDTYSVIVRDDYDYGEFFVRESDVVARPDGRGFDASATWSCVSSYGMYGHHWSSMGEPFAEFVRGVDDDDYLLGKIAHKVQRDSSAIVASITRLIAERVATGACTPDVAGEAATAMGSLEDEHSGDVLCHEIYMCEEVSATGIDLCDAETQEWDPQAVAFVKRLWPKFVAAVQGRNEKASFNP